MLCQIRTFLADIDFDAIFVGVLRLMYQLLDTKLNDVEKHSRNFTNRSRGVLKYFLESNDHRGLGRVPGPKSER